MYQARGLIMNIEYLREFIVMAQESNYTEAADKLFVLKVDLGQGDVRQIVSGLAQSYTPGQVIGKNIVVIANLEPAVIRGVESQGMLLAGKDGTQIAVVEVNGLEPGTRIQ